MVEEVANNIGMTLFGRIQKSRAVPWGYLVDFSSVGNKVFDYV